MSCARSFIKICITYGIHFCASHSPSTVSVFWRNLSPILDRIQMQPLRHPLLTFAATSRGAPIRIATPFNHHAAKQSTATTHQRLLAVGSMTSFSFLSHSELQERRTFIATTAPANKLPPDPVSTATKKAAASAVTSAFGFQNHGAAVPLRPDVDAEFHRLAPLFKVLRLPPPEAWPAKHRGLLAPLLTHNFVAERHMHVALGDVIIQRRLMEHIAKWVDQTGAIASTNAVRQLLACLSHHYVLRLHAERLGFGALANGSDGHHEALADILRRMSIPSSCDSSLPPEDSTPTDADQEERGGGGHDEHDDDDGDDVLRALNARLASGFRAHELRGPKARDLAGTSFDTNPLPWASDRGSNPAVSLSHFVGVVHVVWGEERALDTVDTIWLFAGDDDHHQGAGGAFDEKGEAAARLASRETERSNGTGAVSRRPSEMRPAGLFNTAVDNLDDPPEWAALRRDLRSLYVGDCRRDAAPPEGNLAAVAVGLLSACVKRYPVACIAKSILAVQGITAMFNGECTSVSPKESIDLSILGAASATSSESTTGGGRQGGANPPAHIPGPSPAAGQADDDVSSTVDRGSSHLHDAEVSSQGRTNQQLLDTEPGAEESAGTAAIATSHNGATAVSDTVAAATPAGHHSLVTGPVGLNMVAKWQARQGQTRDAVASLVPSGFLAEPERSPLEMSRLRTMTSVQARAGGPIGLSTSTGVYFADSYGVPHPVDGRRAPAAFQGGPVKDAVDNRILRDANRDGIAFQTGGLSASDFVRSFSQPHSRTFTVSLDAIFPFKSVLGKAEGVDRYTLGRSLAARDYLTNVVADLVRLKNDVGDNDNDNSN